MNYFDWLKNTGGIELNEQQQAAVSFDKGNALVLSTAGSGKTTVAIARAGRLFYEGKCNKKVLTVTFSKMAAMNMEKRFQSYFGGNFKSRAEFSTIHAFSYRIVRDFFKKKGISFEILQNNYQALGEILKSNYSGAYYSYISEEEIENLSSAIGFICNMMIEPSDYRSYGINIKDFDKLFEKYRLYKSQNKLIDFDDMLLYAYKIISGSSHYIDHILSLYEYVQIDEMQDTSKIQHEIIKLVTKGNLFMVGDDDQAIYSFRGSYPDFMLDFQKVYKDGKIFYLDLNYRSDKNIVDAAKKLIEKNKGRYVKSICADKQEENEVEIKRVKDRSEQSRLVINEIKNTEGTVGILYRFNMSAVIFANSLYENNMDFYIKEDKSKFFGNPVLYDILAFLKLAVNPKDREAFAQIYYKSYTYFTKAMCKMVLESPREDLNVYDILDNYGYFDHYVYDKIREFRTDINYLNRMRPRDAIRFIKMELEYMSYLERMNEEGRVNLSSSMQVLEVLQEVGEYCGDIKEFIEKICNLQNVIKNASENKNAKITLSTIHGAKGLEYDTVYMIDNIDGEFPPDRRNMPGTDYEALLEEERRIFYVGMTRAKRRLNIIVPGIPSMFIDELLKGSSKVYANVSTGQKIRHRKYGNGVIVDLKENIVSVKFTGGQTRSFDLNLILENNIVEIL